MKTLLAIAYCVAGCCVGLCAQVFEAESAEQHGTAVVKHSLASGGARVVSFDKAGDRLVFADLPAGKTLRIRYGLEAKNSWQCTLRLGQSTPEVLVFEPTGGRNFQAERILAKDICAPLVLSLTDADCRANRRRGSFFLDCLQVDDELARELADLEIIRRRIRAAQKKIGTGEAKARLAGLRGDGSWPKVNYKKFPGTRHLQWAREIAVAWSFPGNSLYQDPEALRGALLAFRRWLNADPRHSNWWMNDVAVPPLVGDLALLLAEHLKAADFVSIERILHRGWPAPHDPRGLGANLFYRLDGAVRLALWKNDAGLLKNIFARAAREIRVVDKEGIQEDYSLLQHGPQFYAGSYGREVTYYGAKMAELAAGTCFEYPPGRVELLSHFILDCQQWIACGSVFDPGAMGRGFSRYGYSSSAKGIKSSCEILAGLGWPRSAEFAAFAKRLEAGPEKAKPTLVGNRCFYRADFMVHRRENYYFSVKMLSKRTIGSEGGNGEAHKNYHLPDGATMLMRRGDEYKDIQPVWNWRRIPGITCEQDKDPWPRIDWGMNMLGETYFAGGVSDGRYGAAGFDYSKDRTKARKSWFCFDDVIVCLGSGISCTGEAEVFTTLNQCLKTGGVLVGKNAGSLREFSGEEVFTEPLAVVHDGIGYLIPVLDAGSCIKLRAAPQTGSWLSIRRGGRKTPETKEVMSLLIDHGRSPEGGSYRYLLFPAGGLESMQIWQREKPLTVLGNTHELQAVWHRPSHRGAVVFYAAGSCRFPGIGTITVSHPCALLLVETAPGLSLSIANPAFDVSRKIELELIVDGVWKAAGTTQAQGKTRLTIPLHQGRSKTLTLRK